MTSWINPKISVKDSGVEGLGSFAREPIKKGEILVVQGGRIVENKKLYEPEYEPYFYHCFQVEKEFHICPVELKDEGLDGVFRINHSCNPNAGFHGQITVVAMRDISAGEEITYDYAMTDANVPNMTCEGMKCLCGDSNCRGMITGDDWKRKDLQEKYRGYFSRYLQEFIQD